MAAKQIEIGKAYTVRSLLTGKARRVFPKAERGQRITCIADDNGRTVIVQRTRLRLDSLIAVGPALDNVEPPDSDLVTMLDALLMGRG